MKANELLWVHAVMSKILKGVIRNEALETRIVEPIRTKSGREVPGCNGGLKM